MCISVLLSVITLQSEQRLNCAQKFQCDPIITANLNSTYRSKLASFSYRSYLISARHMENGGKLTESLFIVQQSENGKGE